MLLAEYEEAEQGLLTQLIAEWLARRTGAAATVRQSSGDIAQLLVGDSSAALAIAPVATEAPASWRGRVAAFAERLQAAGLSGVIVWAPAGANVPQAEPDASALVQQLAEQAAALRPGEALDARLPIQVQIRKQEDQGAYVSAYGGLAAHWARFTDRVKGYFQIGSTALHRLPADETVIETLVNELVQASAGLAVGEQATVEAADYWRVQRLEHGTGVAVLAAPPDDESEAGAALRRGLRAALRDTGPRLAHTPADLRLLAFYGHYAAMADEPVGAALRGQDPRLFGGLDLVLLAAEGQVRPLIDLTRKQALQPAAAITPESE